MNNATMTDRKFWLKKTAADLKPIIAEYL